MHWIIQKKMGKDPKVDKLIHNLNKLDVPVNFCNVLPFSEDGIEFVDYTPNPSIPYFTYGSYTLASIAKKYYSPASFISEDLASNQLFKNYKNEMFNSDMKFSTIGETKLPEGDSFIRPVSDSKSFTGQVISKNEFDEWKGNLLSMGTSGYATIDLNTEITYAKVKPIHQEIRCFIVDKKVVTCSVYKQGGVLFLSENVDQHIIDYVNRIVKEWSPDVAFCLDVAVTNGVPKILEANCINASGLYAIDTQKFVMAIEDLTPLYTKI